MGDVPMFGLQTGADRADHHRSCGSAVREATTMIYLARAGADSDRVIPRIPCELEERADSLVSPGSEPAMRPRSEHDTAAPTTPHHKAKKRTTFLGPRKCAGSEIIEPAPNVPFCEKRPEIRAPRICSGPLPRHIPPTPSGFLCETPCPRRDKRQRFSSTMKFFGMFERLPDKPPKTAKSFSVFVRGGA